MKLVILIACLVLVLSEVNNNDKYVYQMSQHKDQLQPKVVHFDGLSKASPVDQDHPVDDTGHAVNCGGKTKFDLSWHPKNINPSREVTVSLSLTAGVMFDHGMAEEAVYAGGSTLPFLTDGQNITCQHFGMFLCPVKPGSKVSLSRTFTKLSQLPPGNYRLSAKIFNSKKELFLCANLTVTIDG